MIENTVRKERQTGGGGCGRENLEELLLLGVEAGEAVMQSYQLLLLLRQHHEEVAGAAHHQHLHLEPRSIFLLQTYKFS